MVHHFPSYSRHSTWFIRQSYITYSYLCLCSYFCMYFCMCYLKSHSFPLLFDLVSFDFVADHKSQEKAERGELSHGWWEKRGKPDHILQASSERRTGFGQQQQPLHQLPGHRGEISDKVGDTPPGQQRDIRPSLRIRGLCWSAGTAQEHTCPALLWPPRRWFRPSTARSRSCPWTKTCCSSSTFSSATWSPSLSTMSTFTRRCGGTRCHTLPHTHLW